MSKAFASIKQGLKQAIRHRKGKRVAGLKLRVPQAARGAIKKPQRVP
jgi:hypothetical protein